jgi:hypothetical protein
MFRRKIALLILVLCSFVACYNKSPIRRLSSLNVKCAEIESICNVEVRIRDEVYEFGVVNQHGASIAFRPHAGETEYAVSWSDLASSIERKSVQLSTRDLPSTKPEAIDKVTLLYCGDGRWELGLE